MKPEAAKRQIRAIKGVRDILPPESALWNRVEQTARDVFATYGYGEIRTPVLETVELFVRSIGTDTDIVSKEMYSFDIYAFERFFHWQHEMLVSEGNPVRFTGCLYELLKTLRFAWESEQIEQTPSNKRIIDSLTAIYKPLYDELADDQVAHEALSNPRIQNQIRQATMLVLRLKMGSQLVVLRPEATASVCRAYIEHGMHTMPGDVKLYYIGPMFRRERPQKGRYRQFYQIGAEVLGQSDVPAIDAEVIEMLMAFFDRVGLSNCTLHLNSIGCRDCRPLYVAKLKAALEQVRDKLGPDSQRRIETNPLRVLDSKLQEEQAIIEALPRIGEHLCAGCREHFAALQEQLNLRSITYEINWRLVRGLDYYMRTTFEITATGLGAQNAVCGGGRYDGLVELLGGPPTKGIGFAIGTDRVVLSLQESGKVRADRRRDVTVNVTGTEMRSQVGKVKVELPVDVFVAWMGTSAQPVAVKLARRLRDAGFSVELPAEDWKLKKSLGLADKLGARYAVIIGENEVASGRFTVKRLADAQQRELGEAELIEFLRDKP